MVDSFRFWLLHDILFVMNLVSKQGVYPLSWTPFVVQTCTWKLSLWLVCISLEILCISSFFYVLVVHIHFVGIFLCYCTVTTVVDISIEFCFWEVSWCVFRLYGGFATLWETGGLFIQSVNSKYQSTHFHRCCHRFFSSSENCKLSIQKNVIALLDWLLPFFSLVGARIFTGQLGMYIEWSIDWQR